MTEVARRAPARTELWRTLALLWLAGIGLRLSLLGVAPLLPAIHHDLRLDETGVGLLTGLPIVLLAATSVLGSLLVARAGARQALIAGLLLVAVAGAARGLGGTAPVLYAMTVLMGLGIAVSQPALPSLAQQWWPRRTGLATAVYSNGLLIGEIAGAALTLPLVAAVLGGRWALGLLMWSVPVALTALAVWLFTPRELVQAASVTRWWPDWRSGYTWRLGLILGCASITYFGSNTFIPDYLKAAGHSALISPALASLNLSQLPASFLIGARPDLFIGRRAPIMAAGALIVLSVLGLLVSSGAWLLLWAGLLGFAAGGVFILSLALPPVLSAAHDVHRLSAAMLTIGYFCGFVGPLCGGALWDLSGRPAAAFSAVIAAGVAMALLAVRLALPGSVPAGVTSAGSPDHGRQSRAERVRRHACTSMGAEERHMEREQTDLLQLAEWRRAIAELYATVRRLAASDPAAAHTHWRVVRERLYREHAQSPLPAGQRAAFQARHFTYDPALRFEVALMSDDAPVAPGTAGILPASLGRPGDTRLTAGAPSSAIPPDRHHVAELEAPTVAIETSAGGAMAFRRIGWLEAPFPAGTRRLALFWLEGYAGGLYLPFRDATNGVETYGAGRYLLDAAKSADLGGDAVRGTLILDFNFAYQPSCAFDPRWACPLTPPENRLDLPVRAGERIA